MSTACSMHVPISPSEKDCVWEGNMRTVPNPKEIVNIKGKIYKVWSRSWSIVEKKHPNHHNPDNPYVVDEVHCHILLVEAENG